jgi:hypothetical protein|tara:strand:+ start:6 stop:512 length:507 start_codon:yes stop_codon:yes gene_type:complete
MKSIIRRILRETINDKGLTLSTFNNLPYDYKRGLMTYMVSGEPVEWEEDVPADPSLVNWFNEDEVNYIINQYANVYGNKKFLYGIMDVNDIIEGIRDDYEEFGFDNFNEYHKWYREENKEDYGDSVFPIIISSDEGIDDRFEFIEDGWHRFHSYVDKGITNIPVVKFV